MTQPNQNFMQMAINLGYRNLGNTGPNPSVGCVIVKNNQIIGRGFTGKGGRPHAETIALEMAGAEAKGATVYVTLEPCAHHGNTPPCAEALIKAGVAKVIFAINDPDPRVNGKGETMLKSAGIEVQSGLLTDEAKELHAGFITRITLNRPYITLKIATSLDGRIALANGESKWITNDRARDYAHHLRGTHDAIMVGTNTILKDNPELTCRLPGMEDRSPVRIVVDRKNRVPADYKIFNNAAPTWKLNMELPELCKTLAEKGINRLMVEGGGQLIAAFLKLDLVDELIWAQSPKILGGDSIPAVGTLSLPNLLESNKFNVISHFNLGGDQVLTLKKI